jgi:Ni/Co efflux regulator RcnB
MKVLSRIVLAIVAAGSCAAATAQLSDAADQERRARNREEAIANYERMQQRGDMQRGDMHRGDMHRSDMRRDRMHDDKHRHGDKTVGQRIDQGTQATKNFTHRTLNKMRNFGEKQQRKHPMPSPGTPEPDKAPHAIGK